MTTYAEAVAARLAAAESPDDRRIGALAYIAVAVERGGSDAEIVADVRTVLDALEESSRPVS